MGKPRESVSAGAHRPPGGAPALDAPLTAADTQATWLSVVRCAAESRRILLVLHVRPDGDSVGCSLAVARCLRSLGKQAAVVCADPIPANLRFLAAAEECVRPEQATGPFDLALFLDCADLERIGVARRLLEGIPHLINIDHHPSNRRYGDINFIDPAAGACGELALRLIDDLGGGLDPRTATALFAALATDTGSFRYANTSAHTLALAARLRAAGADTALIGREVWESRSLAALRLLGRALGHLGVDAGGELAWISLTAEDLAAVAGGPGDSEGLVDYPRSLRGVEVAALFVAEVPGEVRVSLRSHQRVDVSALAGRFGGGGHARAAGCTVAGELADVRARVLAAARLALGGASAPGGQAAGGR